MGKGKVHPSPASAGAGTTAEEVLRLLPAAVMVMAAALGDEGKEVLAYLILSSMRSSAPAPATAAKEERGDKVVSAAAAHHRPELGCGCFECYTFYWSRWNSSPERETIHQVIEAFEEHLAEKEKGRRRKKKGKEKQEEKVVEVKEVVEEVAGGEVEEETMPVAGDGEEVVVEERKKGWDVVFGVFNWRFWSIWGAGG